MAQVPTNLVTGISLGNDWINHNKVHLLGDERLLTMPGLNGQRTSFLYAEPPDLYYPVFAAETVTIPSSSEKLIVKLQLENEQNVIFEPHKRFISKLILILNTLLNIKDHSAKILLINPQNRPKTLSRNTKIEATSIHSRFEVCLTLTHSPSNRRTGINKGPTFAYNHRELKISNQCTKYQRNFLSGNDLQVHLRDSCYPENIRANIINLTKHLENPAQLKQIQNILWRHNSSSIIDIPPQSAIETGDHPPIYQYPVSAAEQKLRPKKSTNCCNGDKLKKVRHYGLHPLF
ncbi:unnamed protein product [Didymodactylos carnosus]|uniref:Uncharacterized protein n=1 Tax=Didymodactylos carnosus TaxID=1234261 RepID=A0A8S2F3S4_9BILA|nr:unnamed protein product [Didymodactylos carnosus]CAF4124242.1 unnamed protein product [Didymodactylos carnosus]